MPATHVGIVLDVTEEPIQLANYTRIRGDYPQIQRAIQDLHRASPPPRSR